MNPEPLLSAITRYIHLSDEENELLISKFSYRRYLKGQFVEQQGDVCRNLSFVVSGCLKTFHIDKHGDEHIVMFAIEKWWAGDLGSFISKCPSDKNIQCLEPTELLQLTYENLENLYERIPKLERCFRLIIQKAFVASEKRIIANFSLPAIDRYLDFQRQFPYLEQRIPQYLIASYLGITKEFLSKIRKKQSMVRVA